MTRFGRRQFLSLGVGMATGLVLTACRTGTPDERRTRERFAGDPGEGRLYYGASLPATRSLPEWESELGATLSVHRSYFEAAGVARLVAQVGDDHLNGRLPHVSIKPPRTWGDLAAGRDDGWLDQLFARLAARVKPMFLTVHHEPENDAGAAGMEAADYVAMQERVIRRAASATDLLTVVPVLQHWTFSPVNDVGDAASWVVPSAPVFGVDLYNPWSATNGGTWTSLATKLGDVLPSAEGRPIVIGEYGCRTDPTRPERAADWMRASVEEARSAGVVSMAYFNSNQNSPDGGWALSPRLDRVFSELLDDAWVARLGDTAR